MSIDFNYVRRVEVVGSCQDNVEQIFPLEQRVELRSRHTANAGAWNKKLTTGRIQRIEDCLAEGEGSWNIYNSLTPPRDAVQSTEFLQQFVCRTRITALNTLVCHFKIELRQFLFADGPESLGPTFPRAADAKSLTIFKAKQEGERVLWIGTRSWSYY